MAALDRFQAQRAGLSSPADAFAPITPNDGADLPILTRAVFVGGGGSLVVLDRHGVTATFQVGSGALLPLRVARVMATGTTATGIVALW